MKLEVKYRYGVLKTLGVVFIPFAIALFFLLKMSSENEAREMLASQSLYLEKRLKNDKLMSDFPPLYEIRKVNNREISEDIFHSVKIFSEIENEDEGFFELKRRCEIDGDVYEIDVRVFKLENEDLLINTLISVCLLAIAFSFVFLLLSRHLFKTMWNPFHSILDQLRNFSLSNHGSKIDEVQNIDEFKELAQVSNKLLDKASKEFKNLKEFTENASHEIQTPLAVIRNNIDNMVNKATISEELQDYITKISASSDKLSKINTGLLLLTKIENSQFEDQQKIDLHKVIIEELEWIEGIKGEGITVTNGHPFYIMSNPYLAEILVRNLIKNMITHQVGENSAEIIFDEQAIITFANGGEKEINDINVLYGRFNKRSQNANSLGLGLAITKAICSQLDLRLAYSFKASRHQFTLVKSYTIK